jgi:hypothetical protein
MSDSGTILIKNKTKRRLKNIGHKDQTYDELINELLNLNTVAGIREQNTKLE